MTNNSALCVVMINVQAASLYLKSREVKCYYCVLWRLQFLCLAKKTVAAFVGWYTGWNISQIIWTYLPYPSAKYL